MTRRCAICFNDRTISHWHGYDKHKPRGWAETNWLCEQCRKRKKYREWVSTPAHEVYGIEREDAGDSMPLADGDPGSFETALCIEIMRRYVLGQSQRQIAREADTSLSHIVETIRYWKTHYGYFVGEVKKIIKKAG